MKEEMASHHRYTECGGDYSEECRNSNCSYAYKCSASKDLENRLNKLQEKLNK